jgi:hypothetical protein
MDRNSLQYQSLRQKQENTERQLQHLYTLLYSLSLEVTKLRNSQEENDLDTSTTKTRSFSKNTDNSKNFPLSFPSESEEPSDAINRLLAATRN